MISGEEKNDGGEPFPLLPFFSSSSLCNLSPTTRSMIFLHYNFCLSLIFIYSQHYNVLSLFPLTSPDFLSYKLLVILSLSFAHTHSPSLFSSLSLSLSRPLSFFISLPLFLFFLFLSLPSSDIHPIALRTNEIFLYHHCYYCRFQK